MRVLRCLFLLLALAPAAAAAHDSWLVVERGGRLVLATGNRYPAAETQVPAPATCRNGSCWVQTGEAEVEMSPQLVETYFIESRPPESVLRRWQEMREAGATWRERYSKFARVETASGGARQAVGAPLEVVREGPGGFRVFAFGKPLPGQAVELVGQRSATWSRSDSAGRVQFARPASGQWIVRAIRIEPDELWWRSAFATLVFRME